MRQDLWSLGQNGEDTPPALRDRAGEGGRAEGPRTVPHEGRRGTTKVGERAPRAGGDRWARTRVSTHLLR